MSIENAKSGDVIAFKSQTNKKWYIGTVKVLGNSCPSNLDMVAVELDDSRVTIVDIDLAYAEGYVIERDLAPGKVEVPLEKYNCFKNIASEVVKEGNKVKVTIPIGDGVVVDVEIGQHSTKVEVSPKGTPLAEVSEISSNLTWPHCDRVWHEIRMALKKFMGMR